MVTYDVLIKFVDGTQKGISGANDVTVNVEQKIFKVEKNGYCIFLPMENILYIGRKFDLEEK